MTKRGRKPIEFNIDICVEICSLYGEGGKIKQILSSDDRFPEWRLFCEWRRKYPELNTLYLRAREDKAESMDDEMRDVMDDLKAKRIDPAEARVLIEAIKWRMSKHNARMYGDKLDVTTDGETLNQKVEVVIHETLNKTD